MAGSVGSEDGDLGFQIAPMVDVVFVLLLFFMASAGSQVVEKELSINLPSGSSNSSQVATTPIVIDISPDGQVTMNNQVFGNPADKDLKQLKEWLLTVFGENTSSKDPVIIRPANDAKQERVVDVLNACAAGKVKNLTFG
jgi:biopolymer transport protein ExbD